MTPILKDDLCIRPYAAGDGPAFVTAALESLQTVGMWMSWCHKAFALKDAEVWFGICTKALEAKEAYDVGIFAKDGKQLLGGIGVNQINTRQNFGNIGYWVRQSRQGQGVATRAVKAMIEFGFGPLELTRLEIVAPEKNVPSRRVAEKVGATFECIARNRVLVHGTPQPAAVYSLVPQ